MRKSAKKKEALAACVACLAGGTLRLAAYECAAPLASGAPCHKGTCHEHARPLHPASERRFACRDHSSDERPEAMSTRPPASGPNATPGGSAEAARGTFSA